MSALCWAALLPPPAAPAELGGLSSVRSGRLDNPFVGPYGPQAHDQFAFSLAAGDLDGDGFDDLAVGVPADDGPLAGPVVDAGTVHVYLSRGAPGLPAVPDIVLFQAGGFEPGDRHGHALAICDFDDDGFEDLAVGAMTENVGAALSAGAVFVYPGSANGPSNSGSGVFTQSTGSLRETPETGDLFGAALACADFDQDGYADLAAGAPGETLSTTPNAGWVVVIPGSDSGLETTSAISFTQADSAIPGLPEPDDFFGLRLAAGDFNCDGRPDLAIGAPGEDQTAGAVHLLLASANGVTSSGSFVYTDAGLGGLSEVGDRFGDALAMGDIHGDGCDDLVIGIPGESFAQTGGPIQRCGQMVKVSGTPVGSSGGQTYYAENNLFGSGTSEDDDRFGAALAMGDFDRDGFVDLAVGHPGENVELPADGAVTIVPGTEFGLTAGGVRRFVAGEEGIPGQPPGFVTHREFGAALVVGDFDANGFDDLAIGAPFEPFGDTPFGAATVLYGALFASGFESEFSGWIVTIPPG